VVLKPLQPAEYLAIFSSEEAGADVDLLLVIGYLDFPEPAEYYQYSMTTSYYNSSGYSNPEFDAEMTSALAEFDDTKRAEYVSAAQALLTADAVAIPLVSDYIGVYYSGDLTGLVPAPNYLYAPWLPSLGGK
jgi:peptide/nickel transport system substrate-binding protein